MSTQLSLLTDNLPIRNTKLKPVNVASVPQRSPFRYPGGKTWFVPTFRKWIKSLRKKPSLLIEPFVGGGIISLTALFENFVDRTLMVERDEEIAAVWFAIVNGHADWLANKILHFEMNRDNLIKEIYKDTKDDRERAFITILKNRTYHGGILANGSGILKYGENGKGVMSRWYPTTLAKRLRNLNAVAHRIDFRMRDGLQVMKRFLKRKDVIFFIDPPYTAGGKKAGKRLYKYYDIDHERLFAMCEKIKGDFLITYDNAAEVWQMASRHGFDMRLVAMTSTHHTEMKELVIGKELTWMDTVLSD